MSFFEQNTRATCDNVLSLIDNLDILDQLKFLCQREIVHYQRFGEALGLTIAHLNIKNFYAVLILITIAVNNNKVKQSREDFRGFVYSIIENITQFLYKNCI